MIKMKQGLGVFAWKRLILTLAVLLVINGVLAWFNTPQEEDPQLAPRDGIVTVIYPGAIPSDMERLVAKPLEDELAQVENVKLITTRMRTDFLFMTVKLKDSVATEADTQNAWTKVQEALDRAERKLPETAWKPELNKDIYDQDAVLLAISGGTDSPERRLAILDQARLLKDRLQLIPTVKSVEHVGSPREQMSVVFDQAKLARFGVSLESLVKQLRLGNAAIPSGYVRLGEKKVSVLTNSFYRSADELQKFPVALRSGETLPLAEFATISRTPMIPVAEAMRQNGAPAMAIGVVAQHNVNLTQFGEAVREVVKEFESSPSFKAAGLKIEEISFQPHYVQERIFEIGMDLLKAIFLVGGVLMLMLGFRVGSVVALQVPIVTAISFGLFSHQGGVLNQISIAAFILAIGLLVDNVVVVVDGIQQKLDQGLSPVEAGEQTRKEFLVPLAAGTLTTVAAFMPILMSKGTTADFTRAIGIVATIALLCSYVFCIFVTPIVAAGLLRKGKARPWKFVEPLGARLGALVERFPRLIIAGALVAVVTAGLGFGFVKKQFFPFADRDLLIVDVQLPEGTHFKATDEQARAVEAEIRKDPRVVSVTSFVGRGVPPFYYNLPREPNASHIAQFIVRTRTKKEAKDFKHDREQALRQLVPFGTLIVKEIAQGPVVRAPIEVRVYSRDPEKLERATQQVLVAARQAPGADQVRSTLGTGMMSYRLDVVDSAAGNFGIGRAEVSGVILANTRGLPITTYRGDDDPYSITLMSQKGEESALNEIRGGYLGNTRTDSMEVKTLTSEGVEFSPSVLEHRNRVPVAYVLAELAPGWSENAVTNQVRDLVKKLSFEEGVKVEMGGANAESAEANKAMVLALPLGLLLLLASLMFEFNSFRRIGIILMTIPLCAVGTVPGLILSGSTFGFVTLLGFFTLGGTVIHNGIFLLDYIDHRRHDGVPLSQAITEGIQRRTRPIILTAVATVVELLPMTMSSSTLWPPFAWAIISGLTVSTLMTLLVLPSIYKLAFEREEKKMKLGPEAHAVATALVLFFASSIVTSAAHAGAATGTQAGDETSVSTKLSLKVALDKAKGAPEAKAALAESERAEQESKAYWRGTYMPKVVGIGQASWFDRGLGVVNPLSKAPLPPTLSFLGAELPTVREGLAGRLEVTQPLLDVPHMFYASPAVNTLAEAARLKAARGVQENQEKAIGYFLQNLSLRAKRMALENFVKNLKARQVEIRRLYELGALSEADVLKVKLGIDDAQQGIRELKEKEDFLGHLLAQTVGESGTVAPDDLPQELPAILEPKSNGPRSDLQALSKQIESTAMQAKAMRLTFVPRIEAFAGYTYLKQELLTHDNWADVGIRLTWALFDGGTGSAKSAALSAEQRALESRKKAAEEALGSQAESSRRLLAIKRQEYLERLQGVEDARRASEIEFKRLKQGKVMVINVVDAADLLKDREEKAALSKIAWYEEWFRFQSAAGTELSVPGGL